MTTIRWVVFGTRVAGHIRGPDRDAIREEAGRLFPGMVGIGDTDGSGSHEGRNYGYAVLIEEPIGMVSAPTMASATRRASALYGERVHRIQSYPSYAVHHASLPVARIFANEEL